MSDGLFLGRASTGDDVRLDPSRLRTHGVVLGMTGSGKTGMSLVLLEELVMAGVPIIAIDPKGDLANLGLVFPELDAAGFGPWVPAGEDAAALAERWTQGVAGWGIGKERVRALADRMAVQLFTPGSEAGIPVDVLGALRRPPAATLADPEALRDLVRDTVGGLLGLIGRRSDPVRDPAHIVLSTVLEQAWSAGEDPDLEAIILRLVDPPFAKVGVFPLDRFFPPDERMDLAMALNGVVAAPSFAPWTQGAPMDVDALLQPGARTPVSIFNIAHLDETQRHFFVGLLLGRLLAWSRAQPGTEELRALVFFDEVAGYLPPHPKSPPSKGPLLTMMKQARAVGLGVVLATQNPVDLDYKALSNAGLWCIGRLQTPQDRDRVLKGVGAPHLDDTVQGLKKREFLLHLVGKGEPRVFGTRHAMCYLRGPFTRREVATFVARTGAMPAAPRAAALPPPVAGPPPLPVGAPPPLPAGGPPPIPTGGPPPVPVARAWGAPPPIPAAAAWTGATAPPPAPADGTLPGPPPSDVPQRFLDPRVVFGARLADVFGGHAQPPRPDGRLVYQPALWADLSLRFDEARFGFDLVHDEHRIWFPLGDRLDTPRAAALETGDTAEAPAPGGRFAPLPTWLDEASELKELERRVVEDLYRTESRGVWVNKGLKLSGRAGETREAFDERCRAAVEERVDEDAAKLRDGFQKKLDRLEERVRKKEQQMVELEGVLKARKVEQAVNIGETLLGFLGGRKRSIGSAVTKHRMTSSTSRRLDQTKDDIGELQGQAVELESELEDALAELREKHERALDDTEEQTIGLEKNDIQVRHFGILWVPVTRRI